MHFIKKASSYAMVGGLGAILIMGLSGCEQKPAQQEQQADANAFTQASQKQGAFVVIEEVKPGEYKIVEEYPSSKTRVILRDINGTEKVLTQEELDKLVQQEAKKIEQNQSALVNPQLQSPSGGLSLGEAILASAAGAIIGSWIGSKLFNNPTYEQRRRESFKTPSAYQRSINSFKTSPTAFSRPTSTPTKSGFFKSSSTTKKTSSFSFGG
ncbi:MAG: hypothetical protein GXO61_03900 [Epsilonproteobacteria bacterium]|nr:hypothetical protein [Campylobacterota bacterium]